MFMTRDDFMEFFRDEEKLNTLSDSDKQEVFLSIMPSISLEHLKFLCSDYNKDYIIDSPLYVSFITYGISLDETGVYEVLVPANLWESLNEEDQTNLIDLLVGFATKHLDYIVSKTPFSIIRKNAFHNLL